MKKLVQNRLSKILLAALFIFVGCSAVSTKSSIDTTEISDLIKSSMAEFNVPGVSIAIIENGGIVWAEGFGLREAGTDNEVTKETMFQAASISKPVAAMGALKLVEEGKLDLESNINDYLTSWDIPDNEFTKENHVTLTHILSHTGGLTVHGFGGYKPSADIPTIVQLLKGEEPANSGEVVVDMLPGEKWRYSGGGISFGQLAMSDVTGKDFPELMHQLVLSKVGMANSTYAQPLTEELLKTASAAHTARGKLISEKRHTYPEMAAAGLWTTPTDLAKFAIEIQKSYRGESNKVLSQEMTKKMLTVVEAEGSQYGLGLSLKMDDENSTFGHGGSNAGFRCNLLATISTGYGVVIMTNSVNGGKLMSPIIEKVRELYGW